MVKCGRSADAVARSSPVRSADAVARSRRVTCGVRAELAEGGPPSALRSLREFLIGQLTYTLNALPGFVDKKRIVEVVFNLNDCHKMCCLRFPVHMGPLIFFPIL